MATAFRALRAFVFQKELDSPNDVLKLVREAGISALINLHTLPGGVYVLTLNTRPCSVECRLKTCREVDEEERQACIERCVKECSSRLLDRVVEALEGLASRTSRAEKA